MMYIFHVNSGRMLFVDMKVAFHTVDMLKDEIEKNFKIKKAHQVLLVSGGMILQEDIKVIQYSAGTDTNPIFMFSTAFDEVRANPPHLWPSIEADNDLQIQVSNCLKLPANYSTVVARAQLAKQMHEMAKEEEQICAKLVHEQHLQQQGWAAVIANMEDLADEFRKRFADFYKCLEEHRIGHTNSKDYLEMNTYTNALSILERITISPCLLTDSRHGFSGFDEFFGAHDSLTESLSHAAGGDANVVATEYVPAATTTAVAISDVSETRSSGEQQPQDDTRTSITSQQQRCCTLMQWVAVKKTHTSVYDVAHNCAKTMQMLTNEAIEMMQRTVEGALKNADQENIKEVRGLTERLQGLDKLMFDSKNLVQDQSVHATSFQQNQTNANKLNDPTIFPNLCESHSSQLQSMLDNHRKLRDIRRRISNAKEELGVNLVQRLKYVIHLENRMSELDSKLLFYNRSLRRVQRHLVVIEQIHNAPEMYVHAVTEVIRRRTFSNAFLKWSSELATSLLAIYTDEVTRRQAFQATFEGHFLSALFSGLDDMPPAYAIDAPAVFDASLPNLNMNDLEALSTMLPEVTSKIPLPDLSAVIEFFLSKPVYRGTAATNTSSISAEANEDDDNNAELTGIDKNTNGAAHLKPLFSHLKEKLNSFNSGCDSETDTEEFEKVGQSSIERRSGSGTATSTTITTIQPTTTASISTSTDVIETQSIETLTEDNLGSTRIEVERLRGVLQVVYGVFKASMATMRERLRRIKDDSAANRHAVESQFEMIAETWDKIKDETANRERELINRLTVDHELELNDIKKTFTAKDDEIECFKIERDNAQAACDRMAEERSNERARHEHAIAMLNGRIAALEQQAATAAAEQQRAVAEMRERLVRDHKTEIESLRSRFKLMTTMERSPSDTSLEKIERPDCLDIVHVQMPPTARFSSLGACSPRSPTRGTDMYRQILADKEQQLDELRNRERILCAENQQHKETIQQLADSDTSEKQLAALRNQLDTMHAEKLRAEKELAEERAKRTVMEKSVAVERSSGISRSSQDMSVSMSSRSTRSNGARRLICIESCREEDNVLVMWNPAHGQYTVYQDNPTLYFLHADSHAAFNFEVPISSSAVSSAAVSSSPATNNAEHPVLRPCLGKVVEKEFCYARKDENRYKVTRGTRFYRVKVRPRSPGRFANAGTVAVAASKTTGTCSTTSIPSIASSSSKRDRLDSDRTTASTSTMTASTAPVAIPSALSTSHHHQSHNHFTHSFSQTDDFKSIIQTIGGAGLSPTADQVDSGIEMSTSTITIGSVASTTFKERNISITEDDEPTSITSDRCRYVSVCEEDEHEMVDERDSSEVKAVRLHVDDTSASDKDQDDSDEYRSLDAKDECNFSS